MTNSHIHPPRRRRHRVVLFSAVFLLALAMGWTSRPSWSAPTATDKEAAAFQKHVVTLASKEMQGRSAGLEGTVKAREYLVAQLRAELARLQEIWVFDSGDFAGKPEDGYCAAHVRGLLESGI